MTIEKVFIIVPSAVMDSPVKGAAALANALVRRIPVTFVTLKAGQVGFGLLDDEVERVSLSEVGSWLSRLRTLRRMLADEGGRELVASISFCLSADFFNSWCRDVALTCSSVRGNLPKVYPGTYGRLGKWLAFRHLNRLRKIDHVVSMTHSMSELVERQTGKESPIIGNFVDELPLEKFRRKSSSKGTYHFVYTGSLIHVKQPALLIKAIGELSDRGVQVKLDIIGRGSLLEILKEKALALNNPKLVRFYGFVVEPFKYVAQADVLVLPSLSEGVSRSALEALYLGVPCVMRDVDGNSELIKEGVNGFLFREENDLPDMMLRAAMLSRSSELFRKVLTTEEFRQHTAVERYLKLLNLQDY